MRYLSICSGIESATVAWHPLGWQAVGYAEIEPFPCAVLHHHYGSARPLRMPDPAEPGISLKEKRRRAAMIKGVAYLPEYQTPNGVPNLGDFTQIQRSDLRSDVDLLVGGTPCQDFSVAGLRAGLAGSRGNLTLEFLRLAQRLRPRWLVWENVPGVLSNNGGRDFGAILGGMVELRYGFAYRVLDAQYVRTFGLPLAVPQRRRRVFVVGYLGDWRPAAAVFFDRESLSGNPPPRREAGQGAAPTLSARTQGGGGRATDFDLDGGLVPDVSHPLLAKGNDSFDDTLQTYLAFGGNNQSGPIDVATAQTAHGGSGRFDFESETFVAHALRAEGFDASEDGSGRGIPLVPSMAFNTREDPEVTFDRAGSLGSSSPQSQGVMQNWRVRRLMPVECERLMGFPDGYTDVPYRGRLNAPDGPRYKALGNSKATNCIGWIGERIDAVDAIINERAAT